MHLCVPTFAFDFIIFQKSTSRTRMKAPFVRTYGLAVLAVFATHEHVALACEVPLISDQHGSDQIGLQVTISPPLKKCTQNSGDLDDCKASFETHNHNSAYTVELDFTNKVSQPGIWVCQDPYSDACSSFRRQKLPKA